MVAPAGPRRRERGGRHAGLDGGRQADGDRNRAHLSDADVPVVDSEAGLAELVRKLSDQERFALDTEFHRERTYFPDLALLQLAWPGGQAIVDPLAVDPHALAPVLAGSATVVLHAADQDLEILHHACGQAPTRIFDTQLAAGFLGWSQPSLVNLLRDRLDVRLPKADRLTDWLRRPLTAQQLRYAAADVEHLLRLQDDLADDLDRRGRTSWLEEECEALRRRVTRERRPEDAWHRLRHARRLRGREAGIASEVAAWRDRSARGLNRPVSRVLPDLALLAIAQAAPKTSAELRRVRGIDGRHLKGSAAGEILDAVERGAELRPQPLSDDAPVPAQLRPAVALVSAWVGEQAREVDIDPPLLATRADLEALVRGDADCRLTRGWRAEVVREPVRGLLDGELALAFDREHGLVLERRGER